MRGMQYSRCSTGNRSNTHLLDTVANPLHVDIDSVELQLPLGDFHSAFLIADPFLSLFVNHAGSGVRDPGEGIYRPGAGGGGARTTSLKLFKIFGGGLPRNQQYVLL